MAATPPSQIVGTPDTPLTPLHGAAYDQTYPRRGARSSARIASRELRSTPEASLHNDAGNPSVTTPKSSRKSAAQPSGLLHSPELTPKAKSTRRVHITSPHSPDTHTSTKKQPSAAKSHFQSFASSSTMISDGMLPTPVKTPKKKEVSKVNGTARALFQDPAQITAEPPSSRKGRKNKRYNGFSLESFSAGDNQTGGNIQIFTDSRDRVPQPDRSKANPFVESTMDETASSSQKVAKTAKRRKVSVEKKIDPQVEEAIANDEGMVYVFRGKKVFRRFNDDEDEEEEISAEDLEDLGLLEHTPRGSRIKPIKTLSRRSIKPTRLFQSEQEKRAREQEKEEEALTDIEDATLDGDPLSSNSPEQSPSKHVRSLRSARKLSPYEAEVNAQHGSGGRSSKRSSPFDAWPRVKGSRGATSTSKGRKRGATDAIDGIVDVAGSEAKKTRV
ncbi:hypothetical protein LTR10_018096 [Elasticomyces elasticus]|uniref:DNA replication regulator SLD2 n=1 Tax=Exophiala sideris TaxID=1016849 RepID=A0ABR0IW64_9EURO|nr:hypothetical protein LTR10_018096 [Elasticomyces elasticus]KAK5021693.1 hypothetical protein LTS07_010735 [Exophiala sideris]KAK5025152.1 hypothetical protein LTR13_010589 [Exophiala sideris]KAK5050124.1 hypothetical protein LTR69_010758 [Exophiala sideris]KAK5176872.1 hypothetical protein LTR44_010568 [Eurotiomycetes sp. CCFEE 6388]